MNATEEFIAGNETSTVCDMPGRALVEFRGADRARFLHNFCTNDINRLQVNQGCEAIFTNIKARAVGHGFVFAADHAHWLETTQAGLDELLQHLNKYLITDDVEIESHVGSLREVFVTGPAAADRISEVLGVPELQPLTQTHTAGVWLRRTDMWNQPGILIGGSDADVTATVEKVAEGRLADPATAEALRLQAGFPAYGTDITDEHLAPEVDRIRQTISYTKGCYLGQEPIARIDALGHVNRGLKSIGVERSEPPEFGATIVAEDGSEAGTVTSAAASPIAEQCFALAWLKREHFGSERLRIGDRAVHLR